MTDYMYKLTDTFVRILLIFAVFYLSLIQHYIQEAQLPQRNSASATRDYRAGPLTFRLLMITLGGSMHM